MTHLQAREAYLLADKMERSDTWIPEDCEKLVDLVGMRKSYDKANGEEFEAVMYGAITKAFDIAWEYGVSD